MYFYELSESDDEILANVLLAHDSEYDEQELLEIVLEAREAVIATFEEESLIDAIAAELEKRARLYQRRRQPPRSGSRFVRGRRDCSHRSGRARRRSR